MTQVLISVPALPARTGYWLEASGCTPRWSNAAAPRRGGRAIDIRVALNVVERMSLLDEVRRMRTHMRGVSVLGGEGHELSRSTTIRSVAGASTTTTWSSCARTSSLLYEHARRRRVHLRRLVTALREDAEAISLDFEHSAPRRFDLVVGADGLHSAVRRLACAISTCTWGSSAPEFSAPRQLAALGTRHEFRLRDLPRARQPRAG